MSSSPNASRLGTMLAVIDGLPIAAADLEAGQALIADAVGCILAATTAPAAQPALAWAREQPAGPLSLAWTLGALSNVLEFDAMHVASSVHPGTVVVPAALALALSQGLDMRQVVEAVLRGTEAAIRLGRSTGLPHRRHFQSTSTCGGVGAALACADLLGLPAARSLHALANVASTAGGLWAFVDEPALTKQWHAGHAAQSGLACAQLAAHGLTGPTTVIEGRRGFHAVLCPEAAPEELVRPADAWQVHQTAYKPWPCPRPIHAAITACLGMAVDATDAVRAVKVRTFAMAVDLCDRPTPSTPDDARFSLQHGVAAALHDRRIDLDTFTPAVLERHRALAAAVVVEADDAMTRDYPDRSRARVEVHLEGGDVRVGDTEHALGDPELPLNPAAWAAKEEVLVTLVAPAARQAMRHAIRSAAAGHADALSRLRDALRACEVLR